MNWWQRVCKFFARDNDLNKIARMREEQEHLEQRRDRQYQDISELEHRESDLLEQGRAATSQIHKRRVASQLFHLRQDLKRLNAVAGLVNKKITILATDIHNLSIVNEGQALGLDMPDSETLAENAVAAEQLIESVNNDADLCDQLVNDQSDALESAATYGGLEDIMAEFDDAKTAAASVASDDGDNGNVMVEVPTAEIQEREAAAEADRITA